jgi:CRISPR-associated protein Csx10
MKKLATKYPPAEKSFQAFHFSLTLESDALLIDSYLRAKTGLDSVTLAAALGGIPAEELRPVVHFSGTRMVHGWNIALGLPKPDALAIVKGSTFLFAYTGREVARLQTALGRLEEEGIGLRRGEGFGRLVVCHPFHWEVREHE